MGLHDRTYMRGDQAPPGLRPGRSGGLPFSMCTLLIAVNVIIHLIAYVAPGVWAAFFTWGHFSTTEAIFQLGFWRFLTFQFLHGSFIHLAFNMMGIWFLGRLVEDQLGPKKFLAFYLVCGIFGGLMYLLLNLLGGVLGLQVPGLLMNDPATPLIGASAGVFGVVMACAYIAPNSTVQLLFPPIPMKMKFFAYGFVALALVMLLIGSNNAGGEAAHLGGAIAGFYFIRNTHHLIDFFDVLGDSRKPKPPKRGGRPRGRAPSVSQREVDRVLDKVQASGLGSLTDAEKAVLRQATDRQRRG
ncbi:MAG: rhomboid family intramembrane serine protease [Phycisphaerales bacterium]|jgi:membrane associated rhomboid family serine protease